MRIRGIGGWGRGLSGLASMLHIICTAFGLFLLLTAPVYAATFNQSGSTVQITTINSQTSWDVGIHYSDTTESPIPTSSEKLWNNITVPAGQTDFSFVMPDLHRRYRFDVTSIKPSQQASQSVPANSWSYHQGAGRPSGARWELARGASVITSGAIADLATGTFSLGVPCQSGDVLRVKFGVSVIAGSALSIPVAGTLERGSLRLLEINQGDEYTDDFYYSWSGAAYVVYGATAVDDSGTGTFENPTWVGFAPTSTPEPTSTPDPTSTPNPSATVDATAIVDAVNKQADYTKAIAFMNLLGTGVGAFFLGRRGL